MEDIKNLISISPTKTHWDKIGIFPHNGIVLPLFALKLKDSAIGEYLDLKIVIDWCKKIGFDTIQLLPLNETGKDPSPYNAISSLALNPLHISLKNLPSVNENAKLKNKLNEFVKFANDKRYKYLEIKKLKLEFLKEYYHFIYKDLKKDKDFDLFILSHPWLNEYSLFRVLLEENNFKYWRSWKDELQNINENNIFYYLKKYQEKTLFYKALQYFSFSQLQEVKRYADEKNIILFGDLPILLSKNSQDVWYNKSIFDMNFTAGAPPDKYNRSGQNWDFPIFNWENQKKSNYIWWKNKLNSIKDLYHIYRIDHVVGLFRIWAIKEEEAAKKGRYFPRNHFSWKKNGLDHLNMMINSSDLLPIAEDLGKIPKMVYKTLKNLCIPGTKVVPWQKSFFGFKKFEKYDPLSLTCLSTHDSYTFGQWWQQFPSKAKKFARFKKWQYSSSLTYEQRKQLLFDVHHNPSLFHVNLLQEYLSLYPELVSSNIEDERINIPGTINDTNWTYRFTPTFEEIMSHEKLTNDLKEIIS